MAFVGHFYRSKLDESELDVSEHFVDLDSSFKKLLDEKRQMTNKENNPPPAGAASAAAYDDALTSINPPEKPLRMDLLKEREYKCIIQMLSIGVLVHSRSFIVTECWTKFVRYAEHNGFNWFYWMKIASSQN